MNSISIRRILLTICRFIFAAVFIFSGFVKLVDPLGFTYKIQDYLVAFGPFFETFSFFAFPASVLLSAIEFLIGINLLLGVYRKYTTILAVLFMAVMLPLTLYIAVFNPVTDCGCFGDALVIDNWSTFYKNLFLSVIAVLLLVFNDEIVPFISRKYRLIAAGYTFLFAVLLSVYCYSNLPIIDFRPYKIGTDIPKQMEIPEGAARDIYKTTLVYEKNGIQQEFTSENYPVDDSDWKFIDSKNELIQKGYEPPVHDFSITLVDLGDDITEEILADSDYTFLLISYKLEKASLKNSQEFNVIYDYAGQNEYKFYCLTASSNEKIEEYVEATKAQYPMATMDEITLKTIVRANPGLVLLKEGVVINKWHFRNLPVFDKPLSESKLGEMPESMAVKKTMLASCLLLIPLCLIIILDRKVKNKKNY